MRFRARTTAAWRYDNTTPPAPEHRDVAKPQPERVLWLAVLEDAVAVALREPVRPKQQREREEALEWIAADAEHPQSFRWVCSLLGLDPEPFREGIIGRRERPGRSHAA